MENQLRATPPSVNHGFASVEQERAIRMTHNASRDREISAHLEQDQAA